MVHSFMNECDLGSIKILLNTYCSICFTEMSKIELQFASYVNAHYNPMFTSKLK